MKKLFVALCTVLISAGCASGLSACGIFGEKPTDTDNNHVHEYKQTYVSEPTCTQDGYRRFACSCKESYTEELPALGHEMEYDVCARCGYESETVEHTRGLKYSGLFKDGEIYAYSVSGRGKAEGSAITIPSTYRGKPVIRIGSSAFQGDTLEEIRLTELIERIDNSAFYGCKNLNTVTGADGVSYLGARAFYDCGTVAELSFGSVEYVGDSAFEDCSALANLTFAVDSVIKNIGAKAFKNCALLGHMPAPIDAEVIGAEAFFGCAILKDFEIKAREIGESAFYRCLSFEDIVIADGVGKIGSAAFEGCSANSVSLGAGLTEVGLNAFAGCNNLNKVCFNGDLAGWLNIAFETDNLKQHANPLKEGEAGSELYIGGELLTSVAVPDSITQINPVAFINCASITEVIIPATVKFVGESAFEKCSALAALRISEGLETIGKRAFYGTRIRDLTLPEDVKVVGEESFRECSVLRTVDLPASVTNIGHRAFYVSGGAGSISAINYAGTLARWCAIVFDSQEANPMLFVAGKKLYINGGEVKFDGSAECEVEFDGPMFMGKYALQGFTNITKVTVTGSKLYSIGDGAFKGCLKLKEVVLPASVKNFGKYLFEGCTAFNALRYDGTKTQWNDISKEKEWKSGTGTTFIVYGKLWSSPSSIA